MNSQHCSSGFHKNKSPIAGARARDFQTSLFNPARDKASYSHCLSRELAPAVISHTFQSLEHDDGIASYDNHAQPLAFTTGFLFDGVIEDNVEENLEM